MLSNPADFKKTAIISALRTCQLFAGLPAQDLDKIAAVAVQKPLAKGEYLFRERDRAHGFYAVQSGSVSVHRVNAAGREQIIHIFRPGETFAEAALATEQGYPADACAVEPSQVLLIQKDGFLELLRRQPELALRMLASMSSHLRVLVTQLEDLALKDVETRLANWLVKRCPDRKSSQPVTIEIPTTKRVLAAELGTVSETLSRTLAKLREQKLLRVLGKKLIILSPSKLNDLLRHNLGEPNA
jgi:CRP-like cAMP-binding protein